MELDCGEREREREREMSGVKETGLCMENNREQMYKLGSRERERERERKRDRQTDTEKCLECRRQGSVWRTTGNRCMRGRERARERENKQRRG